MMNKQTKNKCSSSFQPTKTPLPPPPTQRLLELVSNISFLPSPNSESCPKEKSYHRGRKTTTPAEEMDGWLVRQEHYLDELISSQTNSEADLKGLIERVLGHYKQYYEAKSMAAHNDVFMVFSPTWFSALESSFLWISGFKPALTFRILASAVEDLSQEQLALIERLKAETKTEERQLENEIATVQECVAAPPLLEMARRMGRLVHGERNRMDVVAESLRYSMEVLMKRADILRARTTTKVIDILNPVQGVKLLAAAAQLQLQLRLRNWGMQRDTQRNPGQTIRDGFLVCRANFFKSGVLSLSI